ncbi:hypothetical protein B0G80_7390 [Paraburkholderia sp. BL6669N2]|uniref:hypothetical protein n=1 Tax=Paraburkholderia sp. BL6669N2 TaxID=1938807 RepID=UPI000E253AED|nr:hypothetical protein [Paraburkholderia sp. BL6669N2]REG50917.1 hypothetical protein B0G80_7390 [Paraburkholderia sp. BL6669N2]
MSASAIGLSDDQIRLAAIVVQSDDDDSLAAARVKWILNDRIIVMTMGSMLRVRPGREKVILEVQSDMP